MANLCTVCAEMWGQVTVLWCDKANPVGGPARAVRGWGQGGHGSTPNFLPILCSLSMILLSRSVFRTVNICLNYVPFLILLFDLESCLLLLSLHLVGFLWSVIFHFLSKFFSVLFKIVKKLLIVHTSVIPTECLSKDSTQKRVVLSLN